MENKNLKSSKIIKAVAIFLAGIVCIGIFGCCTGETPEPNEKLYSYAVMSDVHQRDPSYKDGNSDFTNAVSVLNDLDLDFVFVTGDIGYDSDEKELELYKNAVAEANVDYYPVRGNHDTKFSDETWKAYTGVDENFEIVKGNDVFLGVSMYESGSDDSTVAAPYGENATWLLDKLEEHNDKRIFLMMHIPFYGGAGLLPGDAKYDTYGFTTDSEEAAAIQSAIEETDNVVVFSGHTHFEFAVEENYPNVNVYDVEDKNVFWAHVPSVAYPRDVYGSDTNGAENKAQCYIVDVYKDRVVLKGFDLVKGDYMEDYVYTLNDDGTVDRIYKEVTAINSTLIPVNGAVYGGVCGDSSTTCRLYTTSTMTGEFYFTFRDLTLTSDNTALYMEGDSKTTLYLEGKNTIDTSLTALKDQRVISSSGKKGNYIIGVGEDAQLILKNAANSTKSIIKGDWTIENATVTATGSTYSATVGIEKVSKGITLRKAGAFTLNSSTVRLLESEGGYLEVNLADAMAGKSTIMITTVSTNEGYTCTGMNVNGVEYSLDEVFKASFTMPKAGETLSIRGIFVKA